MPVVDRKRSDPAATAAQRDRAAPSAASSLDRVPRTLTGTAWLGAGVAAVAAVVLTIFLLQNTGGIDVTFLWMHGSTPLAVALLVASVGAAIVTLVAAAAARARHRRRTR